MKYRLYQQKNRSLPKRQKKSTAEKYFKYIFKEMTREKLTQDDINENHTKHMKRGTDIDR